MTLRTLLALALAVSTLSCGGPNKRATAPESGEGGDGDEEGGGGGGGVTMDFSSEGYCGAVAAAACDLAIKCDNETLFEDRHGEDARACKAALTLECQVGIRPYERGVAAGVVNYNGAFLRKCLDAVAAGSCTEAAAAWGLLSCERGGARVCDRWYFQSALHDDCKAVFTGAGGEGDGCYDGAPECDEGLWCNLATCRKDTDGSYLPGRCEQRERRGTPCATRPLSCAAGLMCSGTSAQNRKCKPLAQQDEECTLDDPAGGGVSKPNCEPPLQCISGTGGQQGGGTGGSFGTCQPLSKQLDACGQGRAKCEPDSYCDFKSTGSIQGDCQPFKEEKAECKDDADPRQCGAGTYCFATGNAPGQPGRPKPDGTCEKYQPLEGLCVKNHANCLEGWCPADAPSWQGFCEPYKEHGQDCSASYQCGPGDVCRQDSATGTKVCAPAGEADGLHCVRPGG